jgi:hypothetical protein
MNFSVLLLVQIAEQIDSSPCLRITDQQTNRVRLFFQSMYHIIMKNTWCGDLLDSKIVSVIRTSSSISI